MATQRRAIIDLTTNQVPQCGLYLPFIEEDGGLVGEEDFWGCFDERSSPAIDVEAKLALRQSSCRLGLATSLWTFDEYCSHGFHAGRQLAVSDSL
ncbi:MAG TPA: hypothetical protein VGG21_08190 [Acidimicrobiales bacterium]